MIVSLATFAANIPVIIVTFRSRRFENDSVAKVIASLAASDIVNGIVTFCCAVIAWSFQPDKRAPEWLLRLINSGMYIFGVCSISHLAAVSVVKCTVIVRPLAHFTIFTDRVLRAIICIIWTLSLVVGGVTNVGVTEVYFNWITMTARAQRQTAAIFAAFTAIIVFVATLIIMTAYSKVYLIVRRQIRSTPADVLGSFGSRTIFGSSVRSARNLFVICVAHYITYLPTILELVLRTKGIMLPDAVQFFILWIYRSSAAVNGFLYISLHSSVRRELRRYFPRCRRNTVVPAPTQPTGDSGRQRHVGSFNADAGAPATAMTSFCVTQQ